MSNNLTTVTTVSSAPAGSVIATLDLSGNGGTGHAQKMVLLSGGYTCTGSDPHVTVFTTVVKSGAGLTVPANTTHLLITVETQDVRMREDGVDPTATNGILLSAGTMIELPIPATAANLRFISSSASVTGYLNVSYRSYR